MPGNALTSWSALRARNRSACAPVRRPFDFEKWYFDGQTAAGDFFFLYLAPMKLLGSASAELVVALFPACGPPLRRSLNLKGAELQLAEDRCAAAFPGGELRLGPQECLFRLDAGDIRTELRYQPLDDPWLPADDGILARRGERILRWVVPVPRARLQGVLRIGDTEFRFDGWGYSDFVRTDIPPWTLPLRELLWGRALGPETLVIWDRIGLAGREGTERIGLGLVSLGNEPPREVTAIEADFRESVEHEPTRDRYPTDMALQLGQPARQLRLHPTRLQLGEFVADVQRFRSELERWLYRQFTGNPVEYKLLSRISAADGPLDAWAAHEWVLWGRGR